MSEKIEVEVTFRGKFSGALGITYLIPDAVYVVTKDEDSIILALYEGHTKSGHKYDCVSGIRY
jgi:hypothetical protein